MLSILDYDFMKIEYEERLREAEIERLIQKAQSARTQQRKGFFLYGRTFRKWPGQSGRILASN